MRIESVDENATTAWLRSHVVEDVRTVCDRRHWALTRNHAMREWGGGLNERDALPGCRWACLTRRNAPTPSASTCMSQARGCRRTWTARRLSAPSARCRCSHITRSHLATGSPPSARAAPPFRSACAFVCLSAPSYDSRASQQAPTGCTPCHHIHIGAFRSLAVGLGRMRVRRTSPFALQPE